MPKHILIDSYFGLVRTAIAQGNRLLDYYEESPDQGRSKGNIYLGLVKKVDAHIQAAFVRYGGGRDGFLPLRDIPFRSEGKGGKGKGGEMPIGQGDTVLVQVVKDEVGSKGAALTTKLSLSGRYLVYMPGRDGEGGISSRINDEERAALKKVLGELRIPEGSSVILRTAALGKPAEELQDDLDRLIEAYREIEEQADGRKEPGLIHRDAPPALRYLREYYTPDVETIWVNREDVLEQCRQFFYLYEPKSAAKVFLSKEGPLMFQKLGLEAEVDRLTARKVTLPSGANFVIDQTEALVAIDVNSAKSKDRDGSVGRGQGSGDDEERGESRKGESRRREKELEDTVFAINMEAGQEIARQLRLRDLGGIIVVDFIDMEEESHRRKLEESMRRALSGDKAKVKVYDISPLGLMQISRQRLRKAGPHFSKSACGACQGRGWLQSPAVAAFAALRRMEERLQGRRVAGALTVTAPPAVANQLMNEYRAFVLTLEERHGVQVRVLADARAEDVVVSVQGAEGEPAKAVHPARTKAAGTEAAPAAEAEPPEARGPAEEERKDGPREKGKGRRKERGKPARGGRAEPVPQESPVAEIAPGSEPGAQDTAPEPGPEPEVELEPFAGEREQVEAGRGPDSGEEGRTLEAAPETDAPRGPEDADEGGEAKGEGKGRRSRRGRGRKEGGRRAPEDRPAPPRQGQGRPHGHPAQPTAQPPARQQGRGRDGGSKGGPGGEDKSRDREARRGEPQEGHGQGQDRHGPRPQGGERDRERDRDAEGAGQQGGRGKRRGRRRGRQGRGEGDRQGGGGAAEPQPAMPMPERPRGKPIEY